MNDKANDCNAALLRQCKGIIDTRKWQHHNFRDKQRKDYDLFGVFLKNKVSFCHAIASQVLWELVLSGHSGVRGRYQGEEQRASPPDDS